MSKFEKGISGNPGGRPKEVAEVRELARKYTDEAVETLVSIMQDVKSPANARIAAATALLDRGYGRAGQSLSIAADAATLSLASCLDQAIAARAMRKGDARGD